MDPLDYDDLDFHQKQILDSIRDRKILIGGRQIGKTETIVHEAVYRFRHGERVGVGAPTHRHTREIMSRIREHLEHHPLSKNNKLHLVSDKNSGGEIIGVPGNRDYSDFMMGFKMRQENKRNADAYLIDDSNHVNEGKLRALESSAKDHDIVLATTPGRVRGITDVWAELYNAEWYTVHASSYDPSFTDPEHIDHLVEEWSEEKVKHEIYGRYKREDR